MNKMEKGCSKNKEREKTHEETEFHNSIQD